MDVAAKPRAGGVSFRLQAFGLHIVGSVCLLSLTVGGIYAGWYRWPGWYLTGMLHIAALVATVDVLLGPLLTLIIANPAKPRRELARDIAFIVIVQLAALIYGAGALWRGRPLYYVFSANRFVMVQASRLPTTEIALGRQQNPSFAPTWYSLPRWVWAPLPENKLERDKIIRSALSGGPDVTRMPRFYEAWSQGAPELRTRLRKVDDLKLFRKAERQSLALQMSRLGYAPDQPNAMILMGGAKPILTVFDLRTLRVAAVLAPH